MKVLKVMVTVATPDITDWTQILTTAEVEELQNYAAKIRWGFCQSTLAEQIKRFENGDTKEKCKVYFLLEDCNFHDVARMLAKGEVAAAYNWAKTELP